MKITTSELSNILDSLPNPNTWKGVRHYKAIKMPEVALVLDGHIAPPQIRRDLNEITFVHTRMTDGGFEWVLDLSENPFTINELQKMDHGLTAFHDEPFSLRSKIRTMINNYFN